MMDLTSRNGEYDFACMIMETLGACLGTEQKRIIWDWIAMRLAALNMVILRGIFSGFWRQRWRSIERHESATGNQ